MAEGKEPFEYECAADHISVDVIFPGARVKNKMVMCENLVKEEKARLLAEENVVEPLANELKFVILMPQGREIPMADEKLVSDYNDDLGGDTQIEIRRKNAPVDEDGRPLDAGKFNLQMKNSD